MNSHQRHYQNNKEKIKAAAILWNKTHRERKRAYDKKFRAKQKSMKQPKVFLSAEEKATRRAARALAVACKKVGITVEFYNSLPKICSNPGCNATNPGPKDWNKDHDHKTGKFRGLLCCSCNTSLGLLGEDKSRIAGLITYLERFL
jgi:hypothetical protein